MKVFISADIEGCAGVTLSEETHRTEAVYASCARQMTLEVLAACEAAHEAGADEIIVKDGHGDAANIDMMEFPDYVTLIRGRSFHPINMMYGLDEDTDAVLYIGYHAPAGDPGSPLSHTSTGATNFIHLNGERMSEFLLNTYTAASMGVPCVFLSGDQRICEIAKEKVGAITTVATKRGVGGCTVGMSPVKAVEEIRKGVREALSGNFDRCRVQLPEHFVYEPNFKDLKKCYKMSFYPGMQQVDERTLRLESDRYMDIVTAHYFVVY